MNTPKYILDLPVPVGMFPAGRSVVERSHAAKLLSFTAEAEISRLDGDDYRPLRVFGVKDGETILFVRPGGFGDLLFLTPTFRALKQQCPGCRIVVSTIPKYGDVLRCNPDVDQITAYPPPLEVWREADSHVWLERIIEDSPEARTTHAVELVAAEAGVALEDLTMRYVIAEGETAWATEKYPRLGEDAETRGQGDAGIKQEPPEGGTPTGGGKKLRVGIQVAANSKARTYPDGHLNRVMNMLVEKGFEVFLFGEPGSIEAEEPFVDTTKECQSFRFSCAVLATCDVVIAPDSALCHVAGALGIPTVALYGPFPSELRTAHHQSVAAIDGHAACSPCFFHSNNGAEWPKDCPGWKSGRCLALSNIDPKRVVRTVMLLVAGVAPVQTVHHPSHGNT